MPEIDTLLRKAAELGQALAGHPTVQAYFSAQQDARRDPAARALLEQYEEQLLTIQQLEAEQKPIEIADKQKLKELEGRMAGHETLKKLIRTQADYVAVMSRVNQAMDEPLTTLMGDDDAP